ncbi:Asp-tRNA(Asn)/Glu-tRNA(Gln) amidotransferase subunit GatC [Methylophilaceae bacterium]|jgi:aspartyl-tRNA(Asn)/glutamyl-tRNA(Gln) amidotransferase subunit C|nr:Asp-tRNA(Asn)/Glu-tRNA(Gln) amidotransferase subunit GatC [Methylophilaceae bacterium]|tara:strand:- start:985 stop:1272 length:288 start_codon:yes stop_codon:yes gene_type:complete
MSITREEIKKIANLARISVSQEEVEQVEKKLVGIMALIEKMQEVETDSIEPMAHALDINQPLREDKVTEKDIRDQSLSLAPHSEESLFIVPQVIE